MQVGTNFISTLLSLFSFPSTVLKMGKQHLKCCGCKIRELQTFLLIKSDHVLVQNLIKNKEKQFLVISAPHHREDQQCQGLGVVLINFSCLFFLLKFILRFDWSSFCLCSGPPSVLRWFGKLFLGICCCWSGGTLLGWRGDGGLVLSRAGTEAQTLIPRLWSWHSTPGEAGGQPQAVPQLRSGAGGTNITQISQNQL